MKSKIFFFCFGIWLKKFVIFSPRMIDKNCHFFQQLTDEIHNFSLQLNEKICDFAAKNRLNVRFFVNDRLIKFGISHEIFSTNDWWNLQFFSKIHWYNSWFFFWGWLTKFTILFRNQLTKFPMSNSLTDLGNLWFFFHILLMKFANTFHNSCINIGIFLSSELQNLWIFCNELTKFTSLYYDQ